MDRSVGVGLIEESKEEEKVSQPQNKNTSKKLRCLVVNDCPFQLTTISYLLENQGFKVEKAPNGYRAL